MQKVIRDRTATASETRGGSCRADQIPNRNSERGARALRAGVARAPIRPWRIGRRSHGWRSAASFERAEAWRAVASVRRQGTGSPTHAGRRCSLLKNNSKILVI
jgi:hypothetical protein